MTDSGGSTAASLGTNRQNVLRVVRSNAAAVIVGLPVQLLLLPFVLRDLDLVRFGEWSTLAALLSIVGLAEAGIPTEVARRVAESRGRGSPGEAAGALRQSLTVMSSAGLGIILLTVVLARPVVDLVFPESQPEERTTLRALLIGTAALLAVSLVAGTWTAALNGLQRTDVGAASGVMGLVSSAAATIVGLSLGLGLWALLIASAARTLVTLSAPAVFLWRLGSDFRPRLARVSRTQAWSLISGSGLLMTAAVANIFDYQFDKVVLARYAGAAVSGHYQIGATLSLEARELALVPAGVMLAGAAELRWGTTERLDSLLRRATSATACVAAVSLGGVIAFAHPFIGVWLGSGYGESAHATAVMASALLISTSTATWYFYAAGAGLQRIIAVSAAGNLVCNVTCALVLTPRLGLDGALIGSFGGHLLGAVLMYAGIQYKTPVLRLGLILRPTGIASVWVAASALLWRVVDASWALVIGLGLVWLLTLGAALLLLGAAPVRLTFNSRGVRLVWR